MLTAAKHHAAFKSKNKFGTLAEKNKLITDSSLSERMIAEASIMRSLKTYIRQEGSNAIKLAASAIFKDINAGTKEVPKILTETVPLETGICYEITSDMKNLTTTEIIQSLVETRRDDVLYYIGHTKSNDKKFKEFNQFKKLNVVLVNANEEGIDPNSVQGRLAGTMDQEIKKLINKINNVKEGLKTQFGTYSLLIGERKVTDQSLVERIREIQSQDDVQKYTIRTKNEEWVTEMNNIIGKIEILLLNYGKNGTEIKEYNRSRRQLSDMQIRLIEEGENELSNAINSIMTDQLSNSIGANDANTVEELWNLLKKYIRQDIVNHQPKISNSMREYVTKQIQSIQKNDKISWFKINEFAVDMDNMIDFLKCFGINIDNVNLSLSYGDLINNIRNMIHKAAGTDNPMDNSVLQDIKLTGTQENWKEHVESLNKYVSGFSDNNKVISDNNSSGGQIINSINGQSLYNNIDNKNSFDFEKYYQVFNKLKETWKGRSIIPAQFIAQLEENLAKVQIYNRKNNFRLICFGCGDPQYASKRCQKPECQNLQIARIKSTKKRSFKHITDSNDGGQSQVNLVALDLVSLQTFNLLDGHNATNDSVLDNIPWRDSVGNPLDRY